MRIGSAKYNSLWHRFLKSDLNFLHLTVQQFKLSFSITSELLAASFSVAYFIFEESVLTIYTAQSRKICKTITNRSPPLKSSSLPWLCCCWPSIMD